MGRTFQNGIAGGHFQNDGTSTVSGGPTALRFQLPLRATFNFVGFPVEIWTNSSEILAAAEESWGLFRNVFTVPPVQIRLGVLPGVSAVVCPPPVVVRGQRNMITQIASSENFVVLDTRQGFAFGWLTNAAVDNCAYLRYHFLEGTAWILLEALYLTSVHGACVELDGHGILLCGDSGAGKVHALVCLRGEWVEISF